MTTAKQNFRWRSLLIALTLVAQLPLAASMAAPAQAHPNLEHHCAVGAVCFFKSANFRDGIASFFGDDANYGNNGFSECAGDCNLNDQASSLDNDGESCGTRHFLHWFYGGDHFWVAQGAFVDDLSAIGWQDRLTSHDWCGDRPHH